MILSTQQEASLKKIVKSSIQHAIDQIFELYDDGKIKEAEALSREFDVWFQEDYGNYHIAVLFPDNK